MLFRSRKVVFAAVALLAIAGFVLAILQFNNKDVNRNLDRIVVQASWLPNGEFSFVCSAIVEGYYEEEGLDVELRAGGPAISFARSSTILAQEEDVFVSIESVLTEFVEGKARSEESDQLRVKAISAFWQDNPLGFLVREEGPADLEELFMGSKPDGSPWVIGATPDAILMEAIANHYGVSYDDLEIVTTSYDATAFLAGQVDALWGFWTTQAYEAEVADIPYRFLSLSKVPGLEQPSMIVLTREDILNNNPDILERWLRASIRGAEFTLNNPEAAAQNILDQRCGGADYDYDQELWLINRSLPLLEPNDSSGCIGYIDPETVISWTDTYLGITQNPHSPSDEELIDFSILERIYGPNIHAKCTNDTSD
jgi:ABC-type nitrate/sulfonate/bicarbonate transport system substrate-binding protein